MITKDNGYSNFFIIDELDKNFEPEMKKNLF